MIKSIMRQVKLIIVILLGYLCHVCIITPYVRIMGTTPSLLYAVIAIVTVGYGKLRALWVGAFYGLVMETMLLKVGMLDLLLYPVSALFCSVFFADKSASRLQYERSVGKPGRNISPLLRTLLCAALNAAIYEVINVAYEYLGAAELTMEQLWRSLRGILSTTILTMLIMVPVRKLLGFRKPTPENPAELRFGKPMKLDD